MDVTKLLDDAIKAGYFVERQNGATIVSKRQGRWEKKGIAIFPNGSAYIIDCSLDVAKTMRTDKDVREALGI